MYRVRIHLISWLCLLLLLSGCASLSYVHSLSLTDEQVRAEGARGKQPLWRVGLGPSHIEAMTPLAGGRILVSLKKDDNVLSNLDIMMVEASSGKVLWRYSRGKRPGRYSAIVTAGDTLLYRVDVEGKSTLLALDAASGSERWSLEASPSALFMPNPGKGIVIASEVREGAAGLRAYSLGPGELKWQQSYRLGYRTASPAPPVLGPDGIYHFYSGVEKLSARDGKALWKNDKVFVSASSPLPQLEGGRLYLVDSRGSLVAIGTKNGRQAFSTSLEQGVKYTNIFPYGKQVYLRGQAGDKGPYNIYAFDRSKGRKRWKYSGAEVTVSNLLELKGRVFAASPSTLISLNARTGKERFKVLASETGRAFPVHLREAGGKVAFISELIVASFDPSSGRELYSHGISPINGNYLYGLDLNLGKLQARAGALRPLEGEMASYHLEASYRYQNQANHYYKLYRERRSAGDYFGAKRAALSGDIESVFAKAESQMALHAAMNELGEALNRMFEQMSLKAEITRQAFLRRTIVSAYNAAEDGDYVYRPYVEGNFSGVQVVHLPSGRRMRTVLSPEYQDYGLWSFVDMKKGVVYHHGLGLDPSGYVFSEFFMDSSMVYSQQYGNYLMAQPIEVPR